VENFSTWLGNEVFKIQHDMNQLKSTGNKMIVLLGHSMGGIVCKFFVKSQQDREKFICFSF
jgi:uncharacterized protein YodC (DUF2158 family)